MRFRLSCLARRVLALKWFCPPDLRSILPVLVTLRRFDTDLFVLAMFFFYYQGESAGTFLGLARRLEGNCYKG